MGSLLVLTGAILFLHTQPVEATNIYPKHWCHKWEHHQCEQDLRFSCNGDWDEGKCPTPTPTKTPTPTPTVEISPTPTIDPCQVVYVEEKGDEWDEVNPCVTPTITPEVTPTPENHGGPGDGRSDGGSSNPGATSQPGNPSCTVQYASPIMVGFKRISPTEVQFSWYPSTDGADKQSLVYGRKEGQELWGDLSVTKDAKEWTLHNLPPNEMIWGQVVNQKGDCVSRSKWIDP